MDQAIQNRVGHRRIADQIVPLADGELAAAQHAGQCVVLPRRPASRWFPSWALGDIRYGSHDGTNIDYLISNRVGSLGPYVGTHRLYKCPSDRSMTELRPTWPVRPGTEPPPGQKHPRVRTYTMNASMGDNLAGHNAADARKPHRRSLCIGGIHVGKTCPPTRSDRRW